MQEMIKNALLSSAVYPLIVSFVVALACSKIFPTSDHRRDWVAGLAVLAGFLTCFYTTVAFSGFPPVRVFGWIPFLAAFAFAALLVLAPFQHFIRLIAAVIVVLVGAYVYLSPVGRSWDSARFGGILALVACLWIVLWWSHESTRDEGDAAPRILLMVLAATGASFVSIISESAKLAQVSGGLAASVGALFLAWLPVRDLRVGAITTGIYLAGFGCILLNAFFYVEAPLYAIALVLLSSLGHLLLRLPLFANMSGVKKTVLVCLITAIPIVVALSCLVAFAPVEDDAYEY